MPKPPIHTITEVIIEESISLDLNELCQATGAQKTMIIEMIEERLIEPEGNNLENWQFDQLCLKRAKTAMSFYDDLEVNMAGIALALDLLDKIEELERKLKHD